MASAIERIAEGVHSAVQMAIRVIAANGVKAVPVEVKRVQADEKSLTVTAKADSNDPRKHDLVDAAGHVCLLVMAPDDYSEALDGFVPDRDQAELPLSAAELAAGMGLEIKQEQQVEQAPQQEKAGDDPLSKEFGDFDYDDAKQLIVLKANGKPFKAHWVQSRLAVSSDQATTLLLRLLDDQVIAVETEGESALDHSYKVTATLEEVVV